MEIKKEIGDGVQLVRLGEEDYGIYSQMFDKAPFLSLNKNNYQTHFRNPNVEISALVKDGTLISLLGIERNSEMEYTVSDGKTRKDLCSYLFSAYTSPVRRKAGRLTDLIDYYLNSRPGDSFGTRLISDGTTPFSVKPGNESLIKILESGGFGVVGFKPSHGGRVYFKRGDSYNKE